MGRFLIDHESCGTGFDIGHPGNGIVSMTCRGCGEHFEYATTTIEFEREVEFEPVPRKAEAPTDELELPELPTAEAVVAALAAAKPLPVPAAAAATPSATPPPPVKPPPKKPPPRRGDRDRTLVSGLIAFALAALAVATIRLATEDDGQTEPVPPPAQIAAQEGNEKAGAETPSRSESEPRRAAEPKPEQAVQGVATDSAAAAASPEAGTGERLVEAPRFTLVVPEDWAEGEADGGLLLAPGGAAPVSIQAFYEENPGLAIGTMIAETADFLRSRSAGGTVEAPRRFQVDGSPAFELSMPGPVGSQTALGVVAGPTRYLVVAGENPGAPESSVAAAERALSSFRPR